MRGVFVDWIHACWRSPKMHMASFIWILHLTHLMEGLGNAKSLRYRRSSSASAQCPLGCATCSPLNGCLLCKPHFFLHLEQDGMKQRGSCLSMCPRGHYGTRSPHFNSCTKCKEHCDSCFSKDFCTRCRPGHFLFRGKCESSCPEGLTADAATRECADCPAGCELCETNACVRCEAGLYALHSQCHLTCPGGFEPHAQLMRCIPRVRCEVGEWTDWGPCVGKRSARTYWRGERTRIREILHFPSIPGDPCPHLTEFRKCIIKKRLSPIRL